MDQTPLTSHRALLALALTTFISLVASTSAAEVWPDLVKTGTPQGGGEGDAALVIGIGDYLMMPDLPGAVDNARAWYAWLTESRGLPPNHVVLLRNHEATREKILRQFEEVSGKVGRGGTLWLIFIGHGAPGVKGIEGVLVGADAQQEAESLYARSVRQSELLDGLSQGPQARTVALFDTCFSGRTASGAPLVLDLQPLLPVADPLVDPKMVLFTAGGPDQFAGPLPGVRRPAFSYLMLGALRGWADADDDLSVTAQEAINYTRDALAVLLEDRQQTPSLSTRSQSATLTTRAGERGPDLDRVRAPEDRSELEEGTSRISIAPTDEGAYHFTVKTNAGHSFDCKRSQQERVPCVFDKLPPGRTAVRIKGDANFEEVYNVGREDIDIEVDGAFGWFGKAALISIAVIGITGTALLIDDCETCEPEGIMALVDGLNDLALLSSMTFGVLWYFDEQEVKTLRSGRLSASEDEPRERPARSFGLTFRTRW